MRGCLLLVVGGFSVDELFQVAAIKEYPATAGASVDFDAGPGVAFHIRTAPRADHRGVAHELGFLTSTENSSRRSMVPAVRAMMRGAVAIPLIRWGPVGRSGGPIRALLRWW